MNIKDKGCVADIEKIRPPHNQRLELCRALRSRFCSLSVKVEFIYLLVSELFIC
jgi:hypothetical protein